MIKMLLVGSGRMGQLIEETVAGCDDIEIIDIIDLNCTEKFDTSPSADVILDFSRPDAVDGICRYIKRTGAALVSGTTGYTDEDMKKLEELSRTSAVIHSANYSTGIAVLKKVLSEISPVLKGSFDIELTETHHRGKVDAPSGTAKLLLNAIDPNGEYTPVYGREGFCGARTSKEIGVHALRGGTVSGIHTVSFFGDDEIIEIRHTAAGRKIFVNGAINAARAICGKAPGMYTLEELIFN
jgi:4-hydroxy-tetrahydrodipicolinate reductase